jgi:DnaJ-class molecular chaperone
MVGMEEKSMYDTQWQMSNRCRKCHGQGQLLCATCNGLGSRGPRAQMIRRSKAVSK